MIETPTKRNGLLPAIFLAIAATMGFTGLPLWSLLPLGGGAAVIAANTPPERAELAKAQGTYWKQYILLIPIMTGIFGLAYGLGWLIRSALS